MIISLTIIIITIKKIKNNNNNSKNRQTTQILTDVLSWLHTKLPVA